MKEIKVFFLTFAYPPPHISRHLAFLLWFNLSFKNFKDSKILVSQVITLVQLKILLVTSYSSFHATSPWQSFNLNRIKRIFFNLFYKNDICYSHMRNTCFFFNYKNKVEIYFIQKVCVSNMLFKKWQNLLTKIRFTFATTSMFIFFASIYIL